MAHITNKLRGLVAAFVAVFAALALVPGVASAAPIENWTDADDQKVVVTVNNFDGGEQVTVYKVADVELQESNNTTELKAVGSVDQTLVDNYADDASESNVAALYGDAENGVQVATFNPVSGNSITFDADPGLYVVVASSTDGNVEFQHTVIAVSPVGHQPDSTHDSSWWTVDDVTINMKKTNESLQKEFVEYVGSNADKKYLQVGDTLHFKVTFTIGTNEQDFTITDTMSDGLSYVANSIVMKNVAGDQVVNGDTNDVFTLSALSESEGFLLTFDNDWTTAKDEATGTSKNAGTYTIEYNAVVTSDVEHSVNNTVDSSHTLGGDEVTVEERYGWVKVIKFVGDSLDDKYAEGDTLLNDAEFGLYLDANGNNAVLDKNGKPVTFKTGTDGLGIDEASDVLLKPGTYYLKETKAPAGYQLNPNAYQVVVTEGSEGLVEVDVPDLKSTPGEGIALPTTGGAGTVALTAAGVVLVAGAAAFIVRSRKEN